MAFHATLTVWDTADQHDSDSLVVEVMNRAPVVDAGVDVTAEAGATVTLGAAASDPDGDVLSFSWAQVSGPPVLLLDASTRAPSFRAFVGGDYTIRVTVQDGWGGSANDTVTVHVPSSHTVGVVENWKPFVAVIFASILMTVGVWASLRRPWKKAGSQSAIKAFLLLSAPFAVAELLTGILSALTGTLSIPPVVGMGAAVDVAILGGGVAVAILWGLGPWQAPS